MKIAGILFLVFVFLIGAWSGKKWPSVDLLAKIIPN